MPPVKRERTGRGVPTKSEITHHAPAPERDPEPQPELEPESDPQPPAPSRGFPWIPSHILNPLLLLFLNVSISSGLTALAAQYIGDELGTVQKEAPDEYWWYIVPGWRLLKAWGIWWGGFGATESALLTFLSLAPTTHFLATFHPSLSGYAHASTVAISTLSITLPMYLIRSKIAGPSDHHKKHHKRTKVDRSTYISTGLLAGSIYASVMYSSLKTFLTRLIVTYFPSIGAKSAGLVESVERVYHPTPASWGLALPVGFAVADLIFKQALKTRPVSRGGDAGSHGLVKRIWNWFGPRAQTVIKRTSWIAGYMGADALVRLAGITKGGSLEGAAVVGGVWVLATLLTGGVFGWISRE
ncbi:hypothetical protein BDZ91DRAFT_791556 [Kalaharituber pfeilii]|nr:hypothetical protein BDZ91DRAFT_791556 [Kalaharituber pfeilii]